MYQSGLLWIYLRFDCCVYCLINHASAIHLLSQHPQCQGAQLRGTCSGWSAREANLSWRFCTFWGVAHNKDKRKVQEESYSTQAICHLLLPMFFRGWFVFTWAHPWAFYSSEFAELEPRPLGIPNISLISNIMLETAAEQKKLIVDLVTNCRTNRNVHPALNKSREKDLCRRKNFDIVSLIPYLAHAISFFAVDATVYHMF